ncbi:ElyC/SanA/YdcF family protein [Atopococcus tabaci]|uniref:ElyC/SanA/YdcF family protein n=1 Tax=Atopococcus tabaci TaxID=269774 RepID=UPI0024097F84|nr:ElyC/SanA/YdcF family protein [Atopococcus tabaci]
MRRDALLETLKNTPFLIMSHRGFWGGNIIENTIESSLLAFKAGADIVEVDVCRTADHQYYLFHDGGEPRLLSRTENFHELTSAEVDAIEVKNSLGTNSGYKVNKLHEFLNWLPEHGLVNLDRSWKYWEDPEFFRILEESGKSGQLVLKSPVKKEYLESFSKNGAGFLYIPIVKDKAELDVLLMYPDIHVIGVELVVPDLDSDLLDRRLINQLHQMNLFVVANAEKLGSSFRLFGGLDDDAALFDESKWALFLEKGVDVIQTDWPNFLSDYREKMGKQKNAWDVVIENDPGNLDREALIPYIGSHFEKKTEFKEVLHLLKNWRYRDALKLLDQYIAEDRGVVPALLLKGEVLAAFHAYEEAVLTVETALQYEPQNLLAARTMVILYHLSSGDSHEQAFYEAKLKNLAPKEYERVNRIVEFIESNKRRSFPEIDQPLDLLCVYGYVLNDDGSMTDRLEKRLLKTIDLAQKHPQATILLSGGAVQNSYCEAVEMKKYLLKAGIEENRLITLPYAKDTVGNVLEFMDYIESGRFSTICAVTSIEHLSRAWMALTSALKERRYEATVFGAAYEESPSPAMIQYEDGLIYSTVFQTTEYYRNHFHPIKTL